MSLLINGKSINITHMASDFVFVQGAGDHPPGKATIILEVDESHREWEVLLPDGISKGCERVHLAVAN